MPPSKKREIDLEQQIRFLRNIPFFRDFDEHEIRQFLGVSKWLKVPPDTLIINEGATERIFYILVKGRVSVFKTLKTGKTLELTTLATGDCFGEMALVMETQRTAGVRTTADSYLLMVNPEIVSTSSVFLQLKFYKRFCEILVSRLDQANKMMAGKGQGPEIKTPADALSAGADFSALTPVPAPEPVDADALPPPDTLPPPPQKMARTSLPALKSRLQNEKCLAVNPAVALQLAGALTGEGDNTRRLAELISLDPVLSAKTLQVANSPLFRRSCPVVSVPHALVIVGAKNVREVAAETIAAGQKVKKTFGGFAKLNRYFWQHGVIVGRIAALLKEVIRLDTATDIYLAGLFHDLGMLALDQLQPRFYPQLLRPDTDFAANLEKKETEYMGVSHAQAGRWLGEFLGLPPVYLEVMRLHHQPEKAGGEFVLPVALVHLADLLAGEREHPLSKGGCPGSRILESFAWIMIREQHKPFLEVNLPDFVDSFNEELNKSWKEITGGIFL